MNIISNRGVKNMTDGTPARLDLNTFSDTLFMRNEYGDWFPATIDAIPPDVTFVFSGYNNKAKLWADDAIAGARQIDSVFRAHGCKSLVVAALWVSLGENLREVIGFYKSGKTAMMSAEQYAPFILSLLKNGTRVSLLGHSRGGYLACLLAQRIAKEGLKLHAVILFEAAMRCAEVNPVMLAGANRWLCCHSAEDDALKLMQKAPVDEAGGSYVKALWNIVTRKTKRNEPIVGMHGLPFRSEAVRNLDITATISDEHSAAHFVPHVMIEVVKTIDAR